MLLDPPRRPRARASPTSPTSCGWPRRDPVVNVFADYRARTTNLEPRWLGGEMWGRFADGELAAACHVGANLVPVQATDDDARAFAERALARGRTVSTVVGPQAAVRTVLERRRARPGVARASCAGTSRTCRSTARQPVEPDPDVRRTTARDLAQLYPACVAMYTEEVGISPEYGGGRGALPRPGQPADRPRLVVRPVRRGAGWCSRPRSPARRRTPRRSRACGCRRTAAARASPAAGMAAVVELVRADIAPVVSLYVNEWNRAGPPCLRARPASGRRRPSPPSCSDRGHALRSAP